jgi:hypothetical protein
MNTSKLRSGTSNLRYATNRLKYLMHNSNKDTYPTPLYNVKSVIKIISHILIHKDVLFENIDFKNSVEQKIIQFHNEGYDDFNRYYYLLYGKEIE